MRQLHRFEHRPCTLESSIRPGYMISFQDLLHCCFILGLYLYNNVLHLTGIWLEYYSLFQDMCFYNQIWGYDMPHICSFRYSYPLTIMFKVVPGSPPNNSDQNKLFSMRYLIGLTEAWKNETQNITEVSIP
jgi:hypothetical protein